MPNKAVSPIAPEKGGREWHDSPFLDHDPWMETLQDNPDVQQAMRNLKRSPEVMWKKITFLHREQGTSKIWRCHQKPPIVIL